MRYTRHAIWDPQYCLLFSERMICTTQYCHYSGIQCINIMLQMGSMKGDHTTTCTTLYQHIYIEYTVCYTLLGSVGQVSQCTRIFVVYQYALYWHFTVSLFVIIVSNCFTKFWMWHVSDNPISCHNRDTCRINDNLCLVNFQGIGV